ncbi:hypothetical protein F5Y04DRAFT_122613 [Hypomontagnella monticulosa]|nr:hypothetical protein F5Y04DRAFT_122613 [Hypomontagnella monticulosa]
MDPPVSVPEDWYPQSRSQPPNAESESVEDVYFVVLGVTGAGKSTFVSQCSGQRAEIGDSLESCTKEVESFTFMYSKNIRVHLVDSPGFDDTNKSDSDILRDIANWLGSSYKEKNELLSGILMLHRISDARMTGGSRRNLDMFQKLCGRDCFQALTLATTFWSNPPEGRQEAAEVELRSKYWSDMLDNGATYTRHEGGPEAARRILDIMINKRRRFKTNIQVEMVEKGLRLDETAAGRQLSQDLIEAKLKHEQELKQLQFQHNNALRQSEQNSAERFSTLEKTLKSQISEANLAQAKLQTNIAQLQEEKRQEMARAEERLKQQFKAVNERQKQYKAQLNASEKERAEERAALEKELHSLRDDLNKAGRQKACRPTGDDDGSVFETWIHRGLTLIGKFLGFLD